MSAAADLSLPLKALGLTVCHVHFFRPARDSLLLASAAADAARADLADAAWARGADDLDFVLYDADADPSADRERVVDYSFLSARPMPRRSAGEGVAARAAVLLSWMEASYVHAAQEGLAERLRALSPALARNFLSLRCATTGPLDRRAKGVVLPAPGGGRLVSLVVPLLATQEAEVRATLTDVAALYASLSESRWEKAANAVRAATYDWLVCFHVSRTAGADGGRVEVLWRRFSVHMEDACASSTGACSYVPLLQTCTDLAALPRAAAIAHGGVNLAEYIPRLEAALLVSLREPLHFLKLCVALSAHFGPPLEVSPAARDPAGGRDSLAVMTASYCVRDAATCCSFMIGLHYDSGDTFPSVRVAANQYLHKSHEAILQAKVRFPPDVERSLPLNRDGMFEVAGLASAIATQSLASMASLLAAFD